MALNIQTIKEFRKYLKEELGLLYPESEIESVSSLLVEKIAGLSRMKQLTGGDDKLNPEVSKNLLEAVIELKRGTPVQYVLGETTFYGCLIRVNGSTLIPRPETEELVDLVIRENSHFNGVITDLATGSGCIAIAIAKNLPGAKVYALELSEKAIDTAMLNSKINNCDISFIHADLLNLRYSRIPLTDIFVSNPPYVTESEKRLMHINVTGFEPHSALFVPDNDPMLFYRAIAGIAASRIKPGGKIYLEINENMHHQVSEILMDKGFFRIDVIEDINGKKRIIKAIYNG